MGIITSNNTTASDKYSTWSLIDWGEVETFVRSMQIKIADAAKKENWKRVSKLQFKLTHSFRAKLLAAKIITSNKGKNTPGVDGILWSTDAQKYAGALSLIRQEYKPMPLRRIEIPKKNGKTRPLGIPTMRDRAMQCLYKLALEPVAEVLADKNSFGFRPKRSCQDSIDYCFNILSKKGAAQWVLEGDIEKCFDKISHEWLIRNVHIEKSILDMWLKAGFIWENELFPTEEGTPQGGVISPILANLALDGIEHLLNSTFGLRDRGRRKSLKVYFNRYADDFIITCSNKEVLEKEVIPLLNGFLKERGLKLSEEKTKITHIDDGFNFLGFNIRKYKGKLLIKPAKESITRFLREVKVIFDSNKALRQSDLITLLNVKIRGWCNYYRHVVAKERFAYVGFRLWKMCWQWSMRRHPQKGKKWVMNKYFTSYKGRSWRFYDKESDTFLILPDKVPIVRHVKILEGAEVFNPAWDKYFELR